jgi:flagellar biosynthesis/type III secretory pathway chaperone
MNPTQYAAELVRELQEHLQVCQELLAVLTKENQALRSPEAWSPASFTEQRKRLLPRLESVLIRLRSCRPWWNRLTANERESYLEISNLLQDIQNLLPRLMLLDRENQQEMLRRGVMPATQLPAAASQRPNFVANLYRRHAAV